MSAIRRCRLKSFHKVGVAALSFPVLLLSAGLTRWAENAPASSSLENAFFRMMDMPGGSLLGRRPAAESRQQLTELLRQNQTSALYTLRAREDERALDFKAAEGDWQKAAETAQDKTAGLLELADFYYRRVQPQEQIAALLAAAKVPLSPEERLVDPLKTRSSQAFQSALQTVKESRLPQSVANQIYEGGSLVGPIASSRFTFNISIPK